MDVGLASNIERDQWHKMDLASYIFYYFGHIPKVRFKIQGFWWQPKPETQNPFCRSAPEPETWVLKGRTDDMRPGTQLIGKTWDPRPRILNVAPKIQDTCFTWDQTPESQDTEREI